MRMSARRPVDSALEPVEDDGEMPLRIPLPPATPAVERIESRLGDRLAAHYPLGSFAGYSRKQRDAARRFWSQRAWSEYTAIPALAQILIKGVAEKVPLDESAALTAIIHDEALHTQLSQSAAEALGGYVEEVPGELSFDPYSFTAPSDQSMMAALLLGGCLGEATSRALIRARLDYTTHPGLKAITARTLEDESVHVAFAWAVARRVIPELSVATRRELAQMIEPNVAAALSARAGRGRSSSARQAQRRLKDVVAEAGLGSCPAEVEDHAVRTLFERTIVPDLTRLGLALESAR